LQIIAVDVSNKSKTLSLPVVLSTTDSDKPSLDNSSIKVTQQE
jgi:hypothetical protein